MAAQERVNYIKDTANALNLSHATICRVIKHDKYVSNNTQKRVLEYISEHYPEKLKKYPAKKEGNNITVIMPYKPRFFWDIALEGMNAALSELPDNSIRIKYIFYSGSRSENELMTIFKCNDFTQTDAFAIVPVDTDMIKDKIKSLSEQIPVALFNEYCGNCGNFINIVSDAYSEGKDVANILLSQATDNVCVLIFHMYTKSKIMDERVAGFTETLDNSPYNNSFKNIEIEWDDSDTENIDNKYYYNTIFPAILARKIAEVIEMNEIAGNTIKYIYMPDGNMLPLCIVLRKLKRYDIKIYGHETNPRAMDFFRSGQVKGGYVRQDVFMQGYITIKSLAAKILGDENLYGDTYITKHESCQFN